MLSDVPVLILDSSIHIPRHISTILYEFTHHQRELWDNIELHLNPVLLENNESQELYPFFCVMANGLLQRTALPYNLHKINEWPLWQGQIQTLPIPILLSHTWLSELFVSIYNSSWSSLWNGLDQTVVRLLSFLQTPELWPILEQWKVNNPLWWLLSGISRAQEKIFLDQLPNHATPLIPFPTPTFSSLISLSYKSKTLFCLTIKMITDLLVKMVLCVAIFFFPPWKSSSSYFNSLLG
jgi:hypothetical protein